MSRPTDAKGRQLIWQRTPPDRPGEWWLREIIGGKPGEPCAVLIEEWQGQLGYWDEDETFIPATVDQDDFEWAPNQLVRRPAVGQLARSEEVAISQMTKKLLVQVRWMIRDDLSKVLAIERANFSNPWTEEDVLKFMRGRKNITMVATEASRYDRQAPVLGYIFYVIERDRILIENMAVSLCCRGMGVGRQMVERLVGKSYSRRRGVIAAEPSERNLMAHLFLRAVGFKARRVLRGHYENEDAYEFVLRVDRGDEIELSEDE